MIVNMHEAKTNLSKLISLLEKGEEIIIAKANNPVAKLIKYDNKNIRKANILKGKIKFLDDFDSSNKEIEAMFEGKISE